jgi:hypothetical protein
MPPGSRIVINPAELRTGASRLRDLAVEGRQYASSLRGLPRPLGTPGAVSGGIDAVAATIETEAAAFVEGAVELERRALWAEIADELVAGVPLSAGQLAQFTAWLKDGTMIRYAEDWQARLAGEFVGGRYAQTFKDPAQLEELAGILRAGQGAEHFDEFAAGFIETFGAKNLVDVPRVIQAMEYAWPLNGQFDQTNPRIFWDVARGIHEPPDGNRDWLALLAPFSQALAVATYGGLLTRDTERAIAYDEDTWAMSQLLYQGKFGRTFLADCFQSGVVNRIVEESRENRIGGLSNPYPEGYPLNYFDGDGKLLPLDPKVLVLEALGRNPEAAGAILNTKLNVEVYDITDNTQTVTDPVRLLFEWGHYDDKGAALGHAMKAGVEGLLPSDAAAAHDLTEKWIGETIQPNHPVGDTSAAVPSLGDLVANHYVDDLHEAAYSGNEPMSFDEDRDGFPGSSNEYGIRLSSPQAIELLGKLWDDDHAREQVAGGIAKYQAELVAANTQAAAGTHQDYAWAQKIGSFDALLQSATDADRIDDVQQIRAQRDLIFKGLSSATSLIPATKLGGIVLSQGIDAAHNAFGGPSISGALDQNYEFQQVMHNSMDSMIVSGYYENGALGSRHEIVLQIDGLREPGLQVQQFFDGDHFRDYGSMSPQQRDTFNTWKGEPPVHPVVEPAIAAAHQAYDDRLKWVAALSG